MATGGQDPDANIDEFLNSDRKKGTCKWFNVLKGFGFITPKDGSIDIFVHQSVIHMQGFRSLDDGEEIEYISKDTGKGSEAIFVCGPNGTNCKGSKRRPVARRKNKKIKCYNCGEFANHLASKCPKGPMPKLCHRCKSDKHLLADCPVEEKASPSGKNNNNK